VQLIREPGQPSPADAHSPDDASASATFRQFPAYFYLKGGRLMTSDSRHDDLTAFLAVRGNALLRTAVLLAPGREAGEDLLQEALERLLRKWHKVDGDPEAYLRRIMYNRAVDGWRTRARRKELLGHPVEATVVDHASGLDLRLALISALGRLTPRQRAAIVARYWEQLSEAETAAALGCSVSAVKSAAARGLRTLREAITPDMEYASELSTEEAGR
jgi:RNA polymerase sigma-70 factor (sigma-E family)